MKLRQTLNGLLVLVIVLGGVWWARGRGRAERGPDGAAPRAAAAPEAPMPDVTFADGSVDVGGVRLVLSVDRPIVAFAKTRFRVRAESAGAPAPVEDGRLSFEMTMPMGEHRYTLLPGADGWQEAEVVLPTCESGNRTWFATLEGKAGGKPVSARFRLDLTPPAAAPSPEAPAAR